MHWVYLILAILCEVSGTTCMKLSQGFTRLVPTVLMFCFYLLSLFGLNLALKRIDVSVAYAVWAATGTALVAMVGLLWFKEPLGLLKFISLCLIIAGVVGLNLSCATRYHGANQETPADAPPESAVEIENQHAAPPTPATAIHLSDARRTDAGLPAAGAECHAFSHDAPRKAGHATSVD